MELEITEDTIVDMPDGSRMRAGVNGPIWTLALRELLEALAERTSSREINRGKAILECLLRRVLINYPEKYGREHQNAVLQVLARDFGGNVFVADCLATLPVHQ